MTEGPPGAEGGLRNCDIVMKGGITSGVVYPSAVCELAKAFRFRNIGGTSAGAIAAAATAAAEYGRREGTGTAFTGLDKLPDRLAEKLPDGGSRLFSLFQPSRETRPLFTVLAAVLGPARPWWKAVRIVRAALTSFPEGAILGTLPGLLPAVALLVATLTTGSTPLRLAYSAALLCTLAVALAGGLLGAGVAIALCARQALPRNGFGLCRGYAFERQAPSSSHGPPPLTEWLADLFDELAGKKPEAPLTFGDLKGTVEEAAIRLEVMTSCVTFGRPFRIPFDEVFYFRRADMETYFPPRIVEWMLAHPNPAARSELRFQNGERLYPLPANEHLPVILAVRMSLSFPFLISAVPLYGVDRKQKPTADRWGIEIRSNGSERKIPPPEQCWFSDGGLASNLPIHFFDRPLPRWPAVAINLIYEDQEYMGAKVEVPADNRGGLLKRWKRFQGPWWGGPLVDFTVSLLEVMQNWRDETLVKMPGYRDRIAHVVLDPGEGGMNLNMPQEVLGRLTERGGQAGVLLRNRYTARPEEDPMSWDNHRWVRYRSTMAAIQGLLLELRAAYDEREPGERTYEELILRGRGEPPTSYPLHSQDRRERFALMTNKLVDLARELEEELLFTQANPPRPRGELRIVPRI